MASAVTKPRQLAPTMGPSATPAGVTLRVGPFTASPDQLASGQNRVLVGLALASLADSAASIPDECLGRDLAPDVAALAGRFGKLSLAEEPKADEYPSQVFDCTDPPLSMGTLAMGEAIGPHTLVGVMVTVSSSTLRSVRVAEAAAAAARAGTSDPLAATLRGLGTPIAMPANPVAARAELEAARRLLFEDASALVVERRQMEAAQREYNSAQGLTLAGPEHSRHGAVRERGRMVTEILGGRFPVYDTPAANLRAAKVAYEDFATLEGEEQAAQERHIMDLIDTANGQQVVLIPGGAVSEFPRPEGEDT